MSEPSYKATLKFRCSSEGWRVFNRFAQNGESEWALPTERAIGFLPILVDFLKRRPRLGGAVGLVQQVRIFQRGGEEWIGSLTCLQKLPPGAAETYDLADVVLLAPASYSEDKWNDGRKAAEKRAIAILLGKECQELHSALEKGGWNYDIVLRLTALDEELVREQQDKSTGRLKLRVKAVFPPAGPARTLSEYPLWEPDPYNRTDGPLRTAFCLPWLQAAPRLVKHAQTCIVYLFGTDSSLNVLRNVNEIWQSCTVRNVLLAAESGSGKEVLARLIHHGRARGRFVPRSAAGETWETWKIPLLGQGQVASGPPLVRGFIEKSRGGTLFLDEIDKADASLRSGLLRIIESDEFFRPGSWQHIKFSDASRPLFLFAGSGNGDMARSAKNTERQLSVRDAIELEPPADFWQRIDRKIDFEHPLGRDGTWNQGLLTRYVDFFMRQALETVRYNQGNHHSVFVVDRLLSEAFRLEAHKVEAAYAGARDTLTGRLIAAASRPTLRFVRSTAGALVSLLLHSAQEGALAEATTTRLVEDAIRLA